MLRQIFPADSSRSEPGPFCSIRFHWLIGVPERGSSDFMAGSSEFGKVCAERAGQNPVTMFRRCTDPIEVRVNG